MHFLKKIKIEVQKIFHYFYLFLVLLSFLVLVFTGYFLYKNCYQAIPQAKKIVDLKGKVAVESLNTAKFNRVIKKIEEKTATGTVENINNPFD